jgi:hypothetical protein
MRTGESRHRHQPWASLKKNMRMKTITITGYRRPHLFRNLLESLRANDLSNWHIHARIEPTEFADAYIAIANEMLAGHDLTMTVNPERLGVRRNPFAAVQDVFARGSEINIYLEEDMVVSPDVIRLADWFVANHQIDWLCLSLLAGGCGATGLLSNPDCPNDMFLSKTFNSLGFVVTRQQWQHHFEPFWMTDDLSSCAYGGGKAYGWDWAVYFHLLAEHALHTVQPVLARANHTGREGGEHCPPDFHDLAFGDLPLAGALADAPSYRLVPLEQLPSPVRRHAMLWHQSVQTLVALAAKERAIDELHRLLAERDANWDTARHRADHLSGELATALDQAALQHREHQRAFADLSETVRRHETDHRNLAAELERVRLEYESAAAQVDALRTKAVTLHRVTVTPRRFIAGGARSGWWARLLRGVLLFKARRNARRQN